MASGVIMQADLGPPGADVSVTVTYDTATLAVTGITYANASASDAAGTAYGTGGFTRTWRLAAGSPQNTIDVSKQGVQLVTRTITKASGQVTYADWPDGWSYAINWPA